MPKPPLLPRLISLIKPEERKKYEKWIEMSTTELSAIHIHWLKTLLQKLEEINFPEQVEQSVITSWWEERFPENKIMPAVTQTICRYTEDFFAYQLQEDYPDRKRVDLVFAMLLRGSNHLFLKYYNRELKRFRTRHKMRIDFRYWLNYSQLLLVGHNWYINNRAARKLRGTQPFSYQELSSTLDETVVSYSLERSLFKLDMKDVNISPIELRFLQDTKNKLPDASPQLKAISTIYDWGKSSEIPDTKEIEEAIAHVTSMSTFSGKDFSKTILSAYYNQLGEWHKQTFRPELRMQRVKIYQAFLSVDFAHFTEIQFFALVKLYCEGISAVQHRVSIHSSSERQAWVASHIVSVKQELEPIIMNLRDTERANSIHLMEIYLAFEAEDNDKLNLLLQNWAKAPSMSTVYEAGIRWIKAKHLFLAGDEEGLFEHSRNLDAFLHTHIQKKSPRWLCLHKCPEGFKSISPQNFNFS